jgi:hypothetical protein
MLDTTVAAPSDAHNRSDHHRCGRIRSPWCVVRTNPQAERWACSNLQRLGYVTYLPLAAVRVRDRVLRTMTRLVDRPLFPNYAFVALGEHDPWTPARYAPGVAALLMGDGEPQHLDAGVLEAVQAAVASRRCQTAEITSWAPGMPCSLRKGYAFEGLPAVVISLEADPRYPTATATIAIMMLGHLRNVSVNLDCLKARDE